MPLLVAPHTDLLMPDLLIEGMQKAIPRRARAVWPLADADRPQKLPALDQAGAALLNGDGVLLHGRRQCRGRELEPGHTGGWQEALVVGRQACPLRRHERTDAGGDGARQRGDFGLEAPGTIVFA